MNRSLYEVGNQPCQQFTPKDELFPGSGNEHVCAAPFDGSAWCSETRGGTVSYCENCNRDHHSNGYESCGKGARR